jgi:hypothetical protein
MLVGMDRSSTNGEALTFAAVGFPVPSGADLEDAEFGLV